MTRRLKDLVRACLLLATLAALAPGLRAQSAWTQPEGGAFVQLSWTNIGPYDGLFTNGGPNIVTGREITETSLELYGEYGLTSEFTLLANLPLRSMDSGSLVSNPTIQPVTIPEDSLTDLGNVLLGVRRQVIGGAAPISGELDIEFPTGTTDSTSGLATGLDAYTFRPLLAYGQGFGQVYVQGYVGLSLRTNQYSDDWRFGSEMGYHITPKFLLAGTFDFVDSFENGDVVIDPQQLQTGLYLNDQEYASVGLKGLYELGAHFGLSAAVRGAFWGNNVPEAPFLSFGVYYQR